MRKIHTKNSAVAVVRLNQRWWCWWDFFFFSSPSHGYYEFVVLAALKFDTEEADSWLQIEVEESKNRDNILNSINYDVDLFGYLLV